MDRDVGPALGDIRVDGLDPIGEARPDRPILRGLRVEPLLLPSTGARMGQRVDPPLPENEPAPCLRDRDHADADEWGIEPDPAFDGRAGRLIALPGQDVRIDEEGRRLTDRLMPTSRSKSTSSKGQERRRLANSLSACALRAR